MAAQVASGGKRVRAALCLLACRLFTTEDAESLHFASAIEHVQNLTLVHDDIADGDPHRRNGDAMWKRYGLGHGVNIGDAFVPLAALSVLGAPYPDGLKLRLLELMATYGLQMLEGQNLDLRLRVEDAVTEQQYLDCTARKTGALLAMATVGGGLIGGGQAADLHRLQEFAMQAGSAFQIRDDLLDMRGNKGRMPGCDILEGKRTALVMYAAQRATDAERRQLFEILNKSRETTTEADVKWAWALFEAVKADVQAEHAAETLIESACQHLLGLPESPAKYLLLRLARYLSARDR